MNAKRKELESFFGNLERGLDQAQLDLSATLKLIAHIDGVTDPSPTSRSLLSPIHCQTRQGNNSDCQGISAVPATGQQSANNVGRLISYENSTWY